MIAPYQAPVVPSRTGQAVTAATPAPTGGLLRDSNLHYQGSFRLPKGIGYAYAYTAPIAYNAANNSLFVCTGPPGPRSWGCAEVSIPTPVNVHGSNAVASLHYSTVLQAFADPTEGHILEVTPDGEYGNGVNFGGVLVHEGRLYGTAYIYYDANGAQRVSHFRRALSLTTPSFSGWYALRDVPQAGFVSGWLAAVPPALQSQLGGPVLTGNCCTPIVSRTSYGPAAFAFNPASLSNPATAVANQALLYYTGDHATLGPWEGQNTVYGGTTQIGGLVVPTAFRTVLYLGRNGLGTNRYSPGITYGPGTADPAMVGKPDDEGGHFCYDPALLDKGSHAYPYRYQAWAYSVDDLAAVKAGRKNPWDVKPYATWPILEDWTWPTWTPAIGGVAYDPQRQLLYVLHTLMDNDTTDSARPLIHVWLIG